jgi:hypothetical protein
VWLYGIFAAAVLASYVNGGLGAGGVWLRWDSGGAADDHAAKAARDDGGGRGEEGGQQLLEPLLAGMPGFRAVHTHHARRTVRHPHYGGRHRYDGSRCALARFSRTHP